MQITTHIKPGKLQDSNHNETLVRAKVSKSLKVKTHVKAGATNASGWGLMNSNHSEILVSAKPTQDPSMLWLAILGQQIHRSKRTRPLRFVLALIFAFCWLEPAHGAQPPLRSSHYNGTTNAWFRATGTFTVPGQMTIESWIYREDATRCETILSAGLAPASPYALQLCPRLRFRLGTAEIEATQDLPSRRWTHVAATYDGGTARLYVDGTAVASQAMPNPGPITESSLTLGSVAVRSVFLPCRPPAVCEPIMVTNFTGNFLGNLDEARLWSMTRSPAEIQANMYREIRSGAGLVASYGQGGAARGGVSPQIFGMIPRDLVVPYACVPPTLDGRVNTAGEYAGAEQLVIRYGPGLVDAVAYLVRTDDDLFIGLDNLRSNLGGWPYANSFVSAFFDPDQSRDSISQPNDFQIRSYLDLDRSHVGLWIGNGAGGYSSCASDTPSPTCPPATEWGVGKALCGDDVSFDPACTELRIANSLLGLSAITNGFALGHFDVSASGLDHFIPESGNHGVPATWLSLSYGESRLACKRITISGHVYEGAPPHSTRPIVGHSVYVRAGLATGGTALTGANGEFTLALDVPPGVPVTVWPANIGTWRFGPAVIGTAGIQPTDTATFGQVDYPPCPNLDCQYASADFFVLPPPGSSRLSSFSPPHPKPAHLRRSGDLLPGDDVTIYGQNLHPLMHFYLAPQSSASAELAARYEATPFEWAPDLSWVKVRAPALPLRTPLTQGGTSKQSLFDISTWRWVVHDDWQRTGWQEWLSLGGVQLTHHPYPVTCGFNFPNDGDYHGKAEFDGAFGNNAYICLGAFGYCVCRIRDPLYLLYYHAIYDPIIPKTGSDGGSCVGMASTSLQMARGSLQPERYNASIQFPFGFNERGIRSYEDPTCSAMSPRSLWARVRSNHGVQLSSQVIGAALHQMEGVDLLGGVELIGNPVARLNQVRLSPLGYIISMMNGSDGHAVTPYRVEDIDTTLSRIYIYDSNHPGDPARYIEINKANNTFRYTNKYSGKALFALPISIWEHSRSMPGLDDVPDLVEFLYLWVAGNADPLYIGDTGQTWGWHADGTRSQSLPGVRAFWPLGSAPSNTTVTVAVPTDRKVPRLQVNARGSNYTFLAAQNGVLVQLEARSVVLGSRDLVSFGFRSNRLDSFNFTPEFASSNFVARIGLALGPRERAVFEWTGLRLGSSNRLNFTALKSLKGVELRNGDSLMTGHSLTVETVDGDSGRFSRNKFGPFQVPPGAVHRATIYDWPTNNVVRSELDLNGDGVFERSELVTAKAVDLDGDGLPDIWEEAFGLDATSAGNENGSLDDPDNDGLDNMEEFLAGTHPRQADTDGDDLEDGWERFHGLDPQISDGDNGGLGDPDFDGVTNLQEQSAGTDPLSSNGGFRIKVAALQPGMMRLSWAAVPGRAYLPRFAPDVRGPYTLPNATNLSRVATKRIEKYDDKLPLPIPSTRFYKVESR